MVSRGRRFAVVGGDIQKARIGLGTRDDVTLFGSSGQTGQGELRRLATALRAGKVERVFVVLRWVGHGEVAAIRALCRTLGIACVALRSFGAVRRALAEP
ncbi:hypothetical protein [Nannocystis pusilla]|uniref:hypothetical protein n=1 Tax=Nannocystis pusilla TaxID=889268 RepID=UPI003DA606F7